MLGEGKKNPLFLVQYGRSLINLLKASCFGLTNSQSSLFWNSNPMMSAGDAFSVPSSIGGFPQEQNANPNPKPDPTPAVKKKRNLPGTPGNLKHAFFLFIFSFPFSKFWFISSLTFMGFFKQIQMLKLLLFHRRHSWRRIDLSAKYAIKGSRGIRIYSFTGGVTIFRGSSGKGRIKRSGRRSIFARKKPASTTTPRELWATSQE